MKAAVISIFFFLPLFTFCQVRPTPAAERLKGLAQKRVLEQKSLINGIKFRSIGPSIMGGRVTDIAVNDSNSIEFFVAYATGGLWYTSNNGQSFTPVFDSADVIGIGAIAVDWKTRTIWVGTGETNCNAQSDIRAGIGVFKSTDFGKTWQYMGLPESHCIGKIILNPRNPDIAWVAVMGSFFTTNRERGVYKTTDGGKTWNQTLYVDDGTGAIDLAINPQNPNEIYASMWYKQRNPWNYIKSGKTSGIYKSTDGGNSWNLVTTKASGFLTGENTGRIGLAVYPKNPNIVYAIVDNTKPFIDSSQIDPNQYYRKDFKGLTKKQFLSLDDDKLNNYLKKHPVIFDGKTLSASDFKTLVSSDKATPGALYRYYERRLDYSEDYQLYEDIVGSEIYKSTNKGISWQKMNERKLRTGDEGGAYFGKIYTSGYNENKICYLGYFPYISIDGGKTALKYDRQLTGYIHEDQHVAWIDPKNDQHIIVGNDAGCNITYDGGQHWYRANVPGLCVGQFFSVAIDNDKPYNVYGGMQDNGVWWGGSNNVESYFRLATGDYGFKPLNHADGGIVKVDTRNNSTVYVGWMGNSGGQIDAVDRKLAKQDEKGIIPATLYGLTVGLRDLDQEAQRKGWVLPFILSEQNQDIIYCGANKLYKSIDKGKSFTTISTDLTNGPKPINFWKDYGTISSISESPIQPGILYCGTDDGNIQFSPNDGKTWKLVNSPKTGLPQDMFISRVLASRYKKERVYAALHGFWYDHLNSYVFVSEDYGSTWKKLGTDLPCEPVNVIKEDPKNENILYVGTDGGLYVSLDRGSSFMAWNGGLPRSVPVTDIAIQERENEIVLATYGRSLYIAKLDYVQEQSQNH